jgi:hypothetical protein
LSTTAKVDITIIGENSTVPAIPCDDPREKKYNQS